MLPRKRSKTPTRVRESIHDGWRKNSRELTDASQGCGLLPRCHDCNGDDGRRTKSGRRHHHRQGHLRGQAFSQKGCRYIPHVLAFEVNQEIKIANEDQTSHNIHPLPKLNREWNKSQPPGTPPITEKYDKNEIFPVKCNVHPWMHGNFAVLKNSHFAVTGDGGAFSLANLPPGKYTITAWHESYGDQAQEVTISGSETKTVNFVFKAKPY